MSRVVCVVALVAVCVAPGCAAQERSPPCGGGRRCAVALEPAAADKKREARRAYAMASVKVKVLAHLARDVSNNCEGANGYVVDVALALSSISHFAGETRELLMAHPESGELKSFAENAGQATTQAVNLHNAVASRRNTICRFGDELRAAYNEIAAAVEDLGGMVGGLGTGPADDAAEVVKQKAKQIEAKAIAATASNVAPLKRQNRLLATAGHAKDTAEELRKDAEEAMQRAKVTADKIQKQRLFEERRRRPLYKDWGAAADSRAKPNRQRASPHAE